MVVSGKFLMCDIPKYKSPGKCLDIEMVPDFCNIGIQIRISLGPLKYALKVKPCTFQNMEMKTSTVTKCAFSKLHLMLRHQPLLGIVAGDSSMKTTSAFAGKGC